MNVKFEMTIVHINSEYVLLDLKRVMDKITVFRLYFINEDWDKNILNNLIKSIKDIASNNSTALLYSKYISNIDKYLDECVHTLCQLKMTESSNEKIEINEEIWNNFSYED